MAKWWQTIDDSHSTSEGICIGRGGDMMKFDPIKDDPMDEFEAPVGKVLLAFVGCFALLVIFINIWSIILS